MNLRVKWSMTPDLALRHWRVYLSGTEAAKGKLVAEVNPEASEYVIRSLPEGEYWVRVLAVSSGGTEEDWSSSPARCRHVLSRNRSSTRPAALVSGTAGVVESSAQAAVAADPPADSGPAQDVELIRGPDAARGQLVGTAPLERSGQDGDMGQRRPVLIPAPILPGRRSGGGSQTLVVRGVSHDGKCPGTASSRSVPYLDLPNHYPVVIGFVSGASLSGISAPGATAAWEVDAADGARLRAVPTTSGATAAWGDADSGLLYDLPTGCRYLRTAVLQFAEYDLSNATTFTLECYDEAQRKTAAGAFATMDTRHARFVTTPQVEGRELNGVTDGPGWAARCFTTGGLPVRPLAPTKWEVRYGETSPLTMAWAPYLPGMRLHARYVQAQVTLFEPFGLHQVISPRIFVRAWIPMNLRLVMKSGAFGAADLADVAGTGSAIRDLGVRVDLGNEALAVNIGGTVFTVPLT